MACKYKNRVWDNGWCNVACMYCTLTQENDCKHNRQTNAEWIRSMTDKELAEFIGHNTLCNRIQDGGKWCEQHAVCENCLLEWLKQPAE